MSELNDAKMMMYRTEFLKTDANAYEISTVLDTKNRSGRPCAISQIRMKKALKPSGFKTFAWQG